LTTRRSKTCSAKLRHASAGALFEICQFGASGDVSLGAIVTEKCEGDFLSKLNAAQRRAYDREQKRCQRKYAHEDGTM
jgi:2-keto-4-pentenoate hydratase